MVRVIDRVEFILSRYPLRRRIVILEALIETTKQRIASQEQEWTERARTDIER